MWELKWPVVYAPLFAITKSTGKPREPFEKGEKPWKLRREERVKKRHEKGQPVQSPGRGIGMNE